MSYAFITGASKGMGREMAIALAKRNYDLLLVARSEEVLSALAEELKSRYSVKVFYKAVDLSAPGADLVLQQWIVEQSYPVSFLINNAGYGLWGNFEKLSLSEQQNMLRLNNGLPVDLTYRLLPILKKNTPSYILNVASTAGYQAVPTLTLYAASKSFVVLFSRGLRFELKRTGVSVSCLSPGPVKTGFVDRAGMQVLKETADRFGMNADEVAETAIKETLRKKAEIVPGFSNKLGIVLSRILPKALIETFIAALYKK